MIRYTLKHDARTTGWADSESLAGRDDRRLASDYGKTAFPAVQHYMARRVPGPSELGLAVRCCGWQPTRDPPPVPKRACQGRNAEIINLDILNEILRNVLYRAIKNT